MIIFGRPPGVRHSMLDVKLLRETPDVIRNDLRRRGWDDRLPQVDEAIQLDREWRELKKQVDDLRHRQNQLTDEIAKMKRAGEPIDEKLNEVKGIPQRIKELEAAADASQKRVREILMELPEHPGRIRPESARTTAAT